MFLVGLSLLCLGSFSTFPGEQMAGPSPVCLCPRQVIVVSCEDMWTGFGLFLHDSLVLEHLETLVLLQKSQLSLLILLEANYLTN